MRIRTLSSLSARNANKGFILPTAIILSVAIMIAAVTAVQAISASGSQLNTQYYQTLAKEAATAGLTHASSCLTSGTAIDSNWNNLYPSSTCSDSHSATSTSPLTSVKKWETTYVVTKESSASGPIIHSTGKVTLFSDDAHTVEVNSYTRQLNSVTVIGSGTGNVTASPSKVVTQVASGGAHSCALSSGSVYCWGNNGYGQLGNAGSASTGDPVLVKSNNPSDVMFGKKAVDVQVGADSSCAIVERDNTPTENEVDCWGLNVRGQLGNGGTANSNVPVRVTGLNNKRITKLAMGTNVTGASCALTDEVGVVNVYCWGGNERAQLGNGTTTFATTTATRVGDPQGRFAGRQIVDISINNYSTCAVTDNGLVYCWGSNYATDVFNSCGINVGQPLDFFGVRRTGCPLQWRYPDLAINSADFDGQPVTKITSGGWTSCAIAGGKAYCWGNDGGDRGTLGRGVAGNTNRPVPVKTGTGGLPADVPVTDIDVDSDTTCAIAGDQAYCWGRNTGGQLGVGATYQSSLSPVRVQDFDSTLVTAIGTGLRHDCAVAGGSVYCWGENDGRFLLGDASIPRSYTPVKTSNAALNSDFPATAVAAGLNHTCAIIDSSGFCWGGNASGQLGNNDTTNVKIPNQIPAFAGKNTSLITSGNEFSCAAVSTGASADQVFCWGKNNKGQLGNNATAATQLSPVLVQGLPAGAKITSLSAGEEHACAVANKNVYCWGNNDEKQIGDNSTTNRRVATRVMNNSMPPDSATVVSAGSHTSCAVVKNNLWCWGKNISGVMGDNNKQFIFSILNPPSAYNPTRINKGDIGSKLVSDVTISRSSDFPFACATLQANSRNVCWGTGPAQQLGDGENRDLLDFQPAPNDAIDSALSGQSTAAISAGSGSACALTKNTSLICWGSGASGRIGNGNTGFSYSPTKINNNGSLRSGGVNRYVSAVSVGGEHACAVADSVIHCWGRNVEGQLGRGNNNDSSTPVQVSAYSTVNFAPNLTGIVY